MCVCFEEIAEHREHHQQISFVLASDRCSITLTFTPHLDNTTDLTIIITTIVVIIVPFFCNN